MANTYWNTGDINGDKVLDLDDVNLSLAVLSGDKLTEELTKTVCEDFTGSYLNTIYSDSDFCALIGITNEDTDEVKFNKMVTYFAAEENRWSTLPGFTIATTTELLDLLSVVKENKDPSTFDVEQGKRFMFANAETAEQFDVQIGDAEPVQGEGNKIYTASSDVIITERE